MWQISIVASSNITYKPTIYTIQNYLYSIPITYDINHEYYIHIFYIYLTQKTSNISMAIWNPKELLKIEFNVFLSHQVIELNYWSVPLALRQQVQLLPCIIYIVRLVILIRTYSCIYRKTKYMCTFKPHHIAHHNTIYEYTIHNQIGN